MGGDGDSHRYRKMEDRKTGTASWEVSGGHWGQFWAAMASPLEPGIHKTEVGSSGTGRGGMSIPKNVN